MHTLRTLLLMIFSLSVVLLATLVAAEEGDTTAKERLAQLIKEKQSGNSGSLPQLQPPLAPSGVVLNEHNQALQQQAITEYFVHVVESNKHQRRVFGWQLFSAKMIFGVVIVLVGAGIYFAAVQFHHGLRSDKEEPTTEFEASATGIKISSPVLGVVILTLSLAFFYLYLVHVYPIEFVGG